MATGTRRRAARARATADQQRFEGRMAELERLLGAQRAQLEGRLGDQEERLAAQQTEIERLRAQLAEERSGPTPSPVPPGRPLGRVAGRAAGDPNRSNGHRASRRTLLRLGGAAAAAGVAAGAIELWRPASARAAGARARAEAVHAEFPTFSESAFNVDSVAIEGDGLDGGLGGGSANGVLGTSASAIGVFGVTQGASTTTPSGLAYGVLGRNAKGTAVLGDARNGGTGIGRGVEGYSDTAQGVLGSSGSGDGLAGSGGRYGANLSGTLAPLFLTPQGFAGYPTSGIHAAGEVLFDNTGNLWLCVLAGTPGHWRKVGTVHFGYTGGAINFLPVPIRLLDTRAGAPVGNLLPNAPVAYHGTINVPAAGVTYSGQTIPPDAVGVFGLLTAALALGVNPGDGSSAICWATGAPRPAAVNVVFNPQDLKGAYTANFTMVQCGASGQISIYSQPITFGVAVDYIFDCFGFVV